MDQKRIYDIYRELKLNRRIKIRLWLQLFLFLSW